MAGVTRAPEWAAVYLARGWVPLPIPPREKGPRIPGWQSATFEAADFGPEANVGLRLDGLTAIDADCPEVVPFLERYLPPSQSWGRASKPAAQTVYAITTSPRRYEDPVNGATVVERRSGAGQQSMAPPSIHPSGEPLTWSTGTVSTADPSAACAKAAAGALLARHWPGAGSRDVAAMALAGALVRAGWSAEDVDEFVCLVAEVAGDEEFEARRKAERTLATIESGGQATGLTKLREYVDPRVVDAVRDWLELPRGEVPGFESAEVTELSLGDGSRWLDAAVIDRLAALEVAGDVAGVESIYQQARDLGCRVMTALRRAVGARAKAMRRAASIGELDLHTSGDSPVPICSHRNLALIVSSHPNFAGHLTFDDFERKCVLDGRPLRDEQLTDVAVRIEHTYPGLGVDLGKLYAVLRSGAVPHVHPPREWFESLTWDGQPRLWYLPTAFGAEQSTLYAEYFRRWAISVVARVYEPGCQADYMLTLQGDEGLRKSTGLKAWVGEEWFGEGTLDLDRADVAVALEGKLVWEHAELATLARSDAARFRSFATCKHDTLRRAYGRVYETLPRTCVFCATVNPDDFLPLGEDARRFWVVACERPVDTAWLTAARDQLWAEARDAYRAREPWYLAPEVEAVAREDRGRYRAPDDPWSDCIAAWLVGRESCTTTEAAGQALMIPQPDRTVTIKVGAILRELGWRPLGRGRPRRYYPTVKPGIERA